MSIGEIPNPGLKQAKLFKLNFSPFFMSRDANNDFLAIEIFFFSLLETILLFFPKDNF
jgi:hypothetical protein